MLKIMNIGSTIENNERALERFKGKTISGGDHDCLTDSINLFLGEVTGLTLDSPFARISAEIGKDIHHIF